MRLALHKPVSNVSGKINLPGSKSISNRVLMIKALSGLVFTLNNISDSDDTIGLVHALENINRSTNHQINIGHAGTDMRFLAAFLSIQKGTFDLTGSERMQQRPIKELVDVLIALGADITYLKQEGYPPLLIRGKQLKGGSVNINGNVSSQFISALLLVAPYFTNGLELTIINGIVSKPYIHMTVEIMKTFGASVNWIESTITVKPIPYSYSLKNYTVESDWSAASYFFSMVALSNINTSLTLSGLFIKSLQADSVCQTLYEPFGVKSEWRNNELVISKVNYENQMPCFEYDFINCPDIAQTLACTCAGLKIPFHLKGLSTLRVKETDRILALKNELEKFGYGVEITNESITCRPSVPSVVSSISVSTYHDHRMAMSFVPLCLKYNNMVIEDATIISKSYPAFWADIKKAGILSNTID